MNERGNVMLYIDKNGIIRVVQFDNCSTELIAEASKFLADANKKNPRLKAIEYGDNLHERYS